MEKRFAKAIYKLTVCLFAMVCLCAVCFALPQAALSPALAEENTPLSAELINSNQAITYKYIGEITSFNAEDALYFSDGTAFYKDSEVVAGISGAKSSVILDGKLIYIATGGGIFYKQTLISPSSFKALTVFGQTLYAASAEDNKIITFTANYNESSDTLSLNQTGIYNCDGELQDLCSTDIGVYYKLKNQSAVYKLTGWSSPAGIDNLKAITASSGLIYCLTSTQIISYRDDGSKLTLQKRINFSGSEFIAAGTDFVYTAVPDYTYIAGADIKTFTFYRADLNLSGFTPFIASRGDYDYFYRSPGDVSSRYGGIFVADTKNNRISALSDSGILHYESYPAESDGENYYSDPKSAALSVSGDLYVAHSNNLLTNNTTGKTLLLNDVSNHPLTIQKILFDSSGNIYALAKHPISGENFVFSADAGLNAFTHLSFKNPSAIGFKTGSDVLFYEPDESGTNGAIKNLKGETVAVCPPVKDFCVDFSGKIFAINLSGNLISVNNGTTVNHSGNYDMLCLSNIACDLVDFGDILLVESATNSLKKISAATAGVADMTSQFEVPDAQNDAEPHKKTDKFVVSVKFDTPLFSSPAGATAGYRLLKDSDVFIRYDIEAPQDMYFVAAEYKASSTEEGKLVYGYVYKASLNPPYPYIQPQKNTGRIVIDTNDYKYIYKYPSFYAKTVREVTNGDWVKLLPFAANKSSLTLGSYFSDIGGHKWVRVEVGDSEGYIPEFGLSWSLFSSEGSQPNANATIKENAPLYVYNAELDRYDFLDGQSFLKKGMRVEVTTPFDSSAKYTRVYFSMTNENGEVEVIDIVCYVETKFIDFDGVDILQIVAIASICIAVLLIIILIIWFTRRRKRRYNPHYNP